MAFDQAEQSAYAALANATAIFRKVTAYAPSATSGVEKPSAWESIEGEIYFKKRKKNTEEGIGVPIGSYVAEGYAIGILPDWARIPVDEGIECTIKDLGKGRFHFQGMISVVRAEVEEAGTGTPIQGYFTRQGS
jgi:hypothetical protein